MNMHQPVEMSERSRTAEWLRPSEGRGKRRLIIAAVVIVLLIGAYFAYSAFSAPAEAPKDAGNVPVVTVVVPGK